MNEPKTNTHSIARSTRLHHLYSPISFVCFQLCWLKGKGKPKSAHQRQKNDWNLEKENEEESAWDKTKRKQKIIRTIFISSHTYFPHYPDGRRPAQGRHTHSIFLISQFQVNFQMPHQHTNSRHIHSGAHVFCTTGWLNRNRMDEHTHTHRPTIAIILITKGDENRFQNFYFPCISVSLVFALIYFLRNDESGLIGRVQRYARSSFIRIRDSSTFHCSLSAIVKPLFELQ